MSRYEHHFTVVATWVDGRPVFTLNDDAGWFPSGPVWDTETDTWLHVDADDAVAAIDVELAHALAERLEGNR